jgi:hypothetical protein
MKVNSMDPEGSDNWVYVQTDRSGRWTATELVPAPERISLTLDHPERVSTPYDTAESLTGVDPSRARVPIKGLKGGKAVLVMKNGPVVSAKVRDETGWGIERGEITQPDSESRATSDWMADPAKK